jgi:hypothetical protein
MNTTTKQAADIKTGDVVVTHDGWELEVASVRRPVPGKVMFGFNSPEAGGPWHIALGQRLDVVAKEVR